MLKQERQALIKRYNIEIDRLARMPTVQPKEMIDKLVDIARIKAELNIHENICLRLEETIDKAKVRF